MQVPEKTNQKLRESKQNHDRLVTLVKSRRNVWTKEQEEQLSLIYTVLSNVHDALSNLVNANQ